MVCIQVFGHGATNTLQENVGSLLGKPEKISAEIFPRKISLFFEVSNAENISIISMTDYISCLMIMINSTSLQTFIVLMSQAILISC